MLDTRHVRATARAKRTRNHRQDGQVLLDVAEGLGCGADERAHVFRLDAAQELHEEAQGIAGAGVNHMTDQQGLDVLQFVASN